MSGIAFKEPRQLREWENLNPLLKTILFWVAESLWPSNVPMTVTSVFRNKTENAEAGAKTEVHVTEPHRAADLSIRLVANMKVGEIVKLINVAYQYDPTRPTKPMAYVHDAGTGPHIHVQVHDNTVKRSNNG